MFVLEVLPLSPTAPPVPLSYRSRTRFEAGTLVHVPLRRKIVPGLVIQSASVQESKSALKAATFSLSKSAPEQIGQLPSSYITAAEKIALWYATSVGAVLSTLLVPVLTEEVLALFAKKQKEMVSENPIIERVEAPLRSRRKKYESHFSKGLTLLVVPTQAELDEWAAVYKKYAPITLSGKLSSAKRAEVFARASGARAGLIITTPSFSWIPLPHLTHLTIDRVSAGGFLSPKRPYLNMVHALTELASARGIPLTYGDFPLPIEYRSPSDKPLSDAPVAIHIFDVRPEPVDDERKTKQMNGPWKAVPDAIRKEITKTLATGGRIAVLAARKGYAPTVVCRDCGTAVTDAYGRVLTFTIEKGNRLFRSVDGKTVEAAHTRCAVCESWNLLPLGVGSERVAEELRSAFPDATLVILDTDILSKASLQKTRASLAEPKTIVVGTEGMLPFLSPDMPFDLGVIASADSLLALPFWRARERFVRIGLMLAERSEKMIIATRHPEDAALSALKHPTTSTFWKEESDLRKILHYPPFGTLITFQVEASEQRLAHARTAITNACIPLVPIELPPRQIAPNTWRSVSVLQLPNAEWPDAELAARFSHLSPAIRLHIDSETLW